MFPTSNLTFFSNFLRFLVGVLAILAMAAPFAQNTAIPWSINGQSIELAPPSVKPSTGKGTLVIYRGIDTHSTAPIAVYVNDRFLGAITPGAYIEHNFCSGDAQISTIYVDNSPVRGTPVKSALIQVVPDGKHYISIGKSSTSNQVDVGIQNGNVAAELISRKQIHAISRVKDCS